MPKTSKPKIAIFTSDYGHRSIAQAIQEATESYADISIFSETDAVASFYTMFYQYMPSGTRLLWPISKNHTTLQAITTFFRLKYDAKIEAFCAEHKPDLLISTYFMFNPILGSISIMAEKPYINILTDPKTIHPLVIDHKATFNFTFDEKSVEIVKEIEPDSKTLTAGWFVRSPFEEDYDKQVVRKKLKLHKEKLTFLIASGSEGTTTVMKVLPALIDTTVPIQVIVACGNNKLLYNAVKTLKKATKKMTKNTIIPLKFTKDMHHYMQAADLVIGKAGPNTLFESIATHTPFFAITHIAGQEDGNLDIIKEYKLGFVEENPFKAQKLLKTIIDNPDMCSQLAPSIQKMADYNKKSKEILKKTILKLLGLASRV